MVTSRARELICKFIELCRSLPALCKLNPKSTNCQIEKKSKGYDVLVATYQAVEPNAFREIVWKNINRLHTNYRRDKIEVNKSEKVWLWF
jgi:hypothetical protein